MFYHCGGFRGDLCFFFFAFFNKKNLNCLKGGLSFCKCHQLKVVQLCFKLFITWPLAIIRLVYSVALVLDNDCVVVSYSFLEYYMCICVCACVDLIVFYLKRCFGGKVFLWQTTSDGNELCVDDIS